MTDTGTDGAGWNGFGAADWRRLVDALGIPLGPVPAGAEGLAAVAEAYRRFQAEFARKLATAAPGTAGPQAFAAELQSLTQQFLASLAPVAPPPGAATSAGAEAFLTWTTLLGDITRATATAFAAHLARPDAPATLRGLFDVWIDCAEAAFQAEAHTERYARVQATLFNEAVALKARQQAMLEQWSRAAGMPGRREVDALHDALRELRAELNALRTGGSARDAEGAAAARARPATPAATAKPKPKPKTTTKSNRASAAKPTSPATGKAAKSAGRAARR